MKVLDVDTLAQEIRRVDGSHSLGAGALAEALMPFLRSLAQQQGEIACYRLTHVGTKTDWVSGAPSEYTKEYAARDGYRVELAFTHPAAVDEDAVEWVVNDNAELGVKIGDKFFFMYKGRSLEYETGRHDDGTPMYWRPVGKREFGECCHPVNYDDLRKCGHPHYIGTVSLADSEDWNPLPAALQPATSEGEKA